MSPASAPRSVDPRSVRADDLRYLLAVARTRNRAMAASNLGVDTSTVTRRIRALEHTLGVRLVEQGSSGWELTETGRAVAERADAIEAAVQLAVDAVGPERTHALRGHARVTAPDAFGAYFVAPAVARVRRQHPELSIELLTATRELSSHHTGFDLAITVGTPTNSRIVSETLCEYALGLYATDAYLAEHGEPRCVADVREHTVIWYVDSMLQVGDLDLDKHLPGCTPRLTSTSVFAQIEATAAGGGIGLLPAFAAHRHPGLRRLLPDDVDARLDFAIAARRERVGGPIVGAIRAAVRAEVAARAGELISRGA